MDFTRQSVPELSFARSAARLAGEFAKADQIRDELRSRGVRLHDFPAAKAEQSDPPPSLPKSPCLCSLPTGILAERHLTFDANRYPFERLVAELIAPESEGGLAGIHELPDAQNWLAAMHAHAARPYAMRRNVFDQRFKAAGGFSKSDSPLSRCYVRFVCEVIQPMLAEELRASCPDLGTRDDNDDNYNYDDDEELLFQVEPNLRCHLAGTGHLLVHLHKDADYFHQPNELNFWVPLTASFGANTLWAESSPGAGDFKPFETKGPGEAVRFWGGQCAHYTVANDTAVTRVSIDFRVIPQPSKFYHERYEKSHRRDGLIRFGEGAFFQRMCSSSSSSSSAIYEVTSPSRKQAPQENAPATALLGEL